jgi:AraC-like DNA-binding protein
VPLPASFVVGPFQNELQLFCKGRVSLVAARFWPWGLHALSQVPMRHVKNTVKNARLALGEAAESLDRAVGDATDPDAKLAKLEQALSRLLASAPRAKLLSRPVAIEILKARGVTRIGALQQKHGIPARRLERIFLQEIGVSPKVFCRIVRFNHAKSMIEKDADVDLRQLAYECGYADQSHFTRNFREMFGRTPADYKALMKQAAKLFNEQRDVVFLQDEAAQAD